MGGLHLSFNPHHYRIISPRDNNCSVCNLDIVKYLDNLKMSGDMWLEIKHMS